MLILFLNNFVLEIEIDFEDLLFQIIVVVVVLLGKMKSNCVVIDPLSELVISFQIFILYNATRLHPLKMVYLHVNDCVLCLPSKSPVSIFFFKN